MFEQIHKDAISWLQEARNKIMASFQGTLQISTKSNANDLVTNIDREIEQFFIGKIKGHYPDHKILGEEGFGDAVESVDGTVWIIDPIDGTMNFVHQQRNFFISIGIFENGTGKLGYLYDIIHNELYYAQTGKGAFYNNKAIPPLKKGGIEEAIIGFNALWFVSKHYDDPMGTFSPLLKDARGIRSYGSAALELSYVALGRLDAYISVSLAPWDFAGGKVIIEELGGLVTDLQGRPLDLLKKSPVVVARPGLHAILIEKYLNTK